MKKTVYLPFLLVSLFLVASCTEVVKGTIDGIMGVGSSGQDSKAAQPTNAATAGQTGQTSKVSQTSTGKQTSNTVKKNNKPAAAPKEKEELVTEDKITLRVKSATGHVNVRNKPSADRTSEIVGRINRDTALEQLDSNEKWFKVKFADASGQPHEGWVSRPLLEEKKETISRKVAKTEVADNESQAQAEEARQAEASAKSEQDMKAMDNLGNALGAGHVDVVFNYVQGAEAMLRGAVDFLFSVLASEEDKVRIQMELKAANELQDPKEKEAKIQQIEKEKEALVMKEANNKEAVDKVKALDKKQKGLYANATYNVALAVLYDVYAFQHGSAIVKGCSSSPFSCIGMVFKIGKLTGIVTTLPNQIKSVGEFSTTLSQIGQAAKIEVKKPTSETEKPKEVEV